MHLQISQRQHSTQTHCQQYYLNHLKCRTSYHHSGRSSGQPLQQLHRFHQQNMKTSNWTWTKHLVSFDVTSLFTFIPTTEAVEMPRMFNNRTGYAQNEHATHQSKFAVSWTVASPPSISKIINVPSGIPQYHPFWQTILDHNIKFTWENTFNNDNSRALKSHHSWCL